MMLSLVSLLVVVLVAVGVKGQEPSPPRYWNEYVGEVMVMHRHHDTCHVVGLVARDGVMESEETIAQRSCQQIRDFGPGPFQSCIWNIYVDDDDCVTRVAEHIVRSVEEGNTYGSHTTGPVLLPVVVAGHKQYFVARSAETVDLDAQVSLGSQ